MGWTFLANGKVNEKGWSLWRVKGKGSPFVTFDADHCNEESRHKDPTEHDVEHEEAASVDHVALDNLVGTGFFWEVVARADPTGVTQPHDVHPYEYAVGDKSHYLFDAVRRSSEASFLVNVAETAYSAHAIA